jgi:hypothetical protein
MARQGFEPDNLQTILERNAKHHTIRSNPGEGLVRISGNYP